MYSSCWLGSVLFFCAVTVWLVPCCCWHAGVCCACPSCCHNACFDVVGAVSPSIHLHTCAPSVVGRPSLAAFCALVVVCLPQFCHNVTTYSIMMLMGADNAVWGWMVCKTAKRCPVTDFQFANHTGIKAAPVLEVSIVRVSYWSSCLRQKQSNTGAPAAVAALPVQQHPPYILDSSWSLQYTRLSCYVMQLQALPSSSGKKSPQTPLAAAAWNEDADWLQQQLNEGADVHERDEDGRTALQFAAAGRSRAVVTQLLHAGASVTAADDTGRTALHLAAAHGRTANLQQLLAAGADVAAVDKHGFTALHLAARQGHPGVLKELCAARASLTAVDSQGSTALHGAASSGHVTTLKKLLGAGADAAA